MAFAAVLAAGAAVQMYGQQEANKEEARAQRLNAAAYLRQKEATEAATQRELNIFDDEARSYIGNTTSELARSGITLEGSALAVLSSARQKIVAEHNAIKYQGAERALLFDFQASQATRAANRLESSEYNNLQMFGTLLNAGGRYLGAGGAGVENDDGGSMIKTTMAPQPVQDAAQKVIPHRQNGRDTGLFILNPDYYNSNEPWRNA
jgi:hypothetical protein